MSAFRPKNKARRCCRPTPRQRYEWATLFDAPDSPAILIALPAGTMDAARRATLEHVKATALGTDEERAAIFATAAVLVQVTQPDGTYWLDDQWRQWNPELALWPVASTTGGEPPAVNHWRTIHRAMAEDEGVSVAEVVEGVNELVLAGSWEPYVLPATGGGWIGGYRILSDDNALVVPQ